MSMSNTNDTRSDQTQDISKTADAGGGCCGGPAPAGASACCALDAEVKATGGPGCGCGPKPAAATPAAKKGGCC